MPPLDTVNAGILLSGSATGTFSISFSSTKCTTEYFFIGTEGTLSITSDTSGTIVKLEDIYGGTMKKMTVQNHGVEREIKAFLEAVECGKAESRAGPEDALNYLAVIESLCSSGDKVDVGEI
jgi:predicted dehydrogenase